MALQIIPEVIDMAISAFGNLFKQKPTEYVQAKGYSNNDIQTMLMMANLQNAQINSQQVKLEQMDQYTEYVFFLAITVILLLSLCCNAVVAYLHIIKYRQMTLAEKKQQRKLEILNELTTALAKQNSETEPDRAIPQSAVGKGRQEILNNQETRPLFP